MTDLFDTGKLPYRPAYEQKRMNRHQIMKDREFYQELLRAVYEAGPNGLPMKVLIKMGIRHGWWLDTADKHFGEKMRAAWSYGLLVVPEFPGAMGTENKRVIHPAYFDVTFQSGYIQNAWSKLLVALKSLNFMRIEK